MDFFFSSVVTALSLGEPCMQIPKVAELFSFLLPSLLLPLFFMGH